MNAKQRKELFFETTYHAAMAEGCKAAVAKVPTPMVVQQHENVFDDNSAVTKQWHVPSGVCGFAWVTVRPGNCAFANWLKKNGYGRTDSYAGGVCIWVSLYGQSYEKKVAHADAMAASLCKAGIKACADSRLD